MLSGNFPGPGPVFIVMVELSASAARRDLVLRRCGLDLCP